MRVIKKVLEPYSFLASAANGKKVSTLGSGLFKVKLNGVHFDIKMLVSDDVEEAMLGVDFYEFT